MMVSRFGVPGEINAAGGWVDDTWRKTACCVGIANFFTKNVFFEGGVIRNFN